MPSYLKVADLAKRPETYDNHCIDGKCSGCGECCVDLLPVTPAEINRIREYVQKHDIRERRQAPFFDPDAIDMSCPFRDQNEKKCEIYSVRPFICRTFSCSKPREDAVRDRDIIHRNRPVRSLRYEIFGNSECTDFLLVVIAAKGRV